MDDISPQPLQTVVPLDLAALIARAKNEAWTELILLGPVYDLSGDRETWPEPYRRAPRVFQATEHIGDDGARAIAGIKGLTTLDLSGNQIGADGARAILDAWSRRVETERLRRLDLRNNGDLSALLPEEVLANPLDP
ncbi:MAG: hypothetical protein ACR2QF_08105, partial [Geminicoccaceae bacterium]